MARDLIWVVRNRVRVRTELAVTGSELRERLAAPVAENRDVQFSCPLPFR
jgi:hypothetical protein